MINHYCVGSVREGKKKEVPKYFKSFSIKTVGEVHSINTRNKAMISKNRTRIKLNEKCLRNNIADVMNLTPRIALEKVNTHSYNGFSNYVKNLLLKNYSSQCSILNCYICRK